MCYACVIIFLYFYLPPDLVLYMTDYKLATGEQIL